VTEGLARLGNDGPYLGGSEDGGTFDRFDALRRSATPRRPKPRYRGVVHLYGFLASLPAGTALVASAPTPSARTTALVFAMSISALLGVSALYHRVNWSPRPRWWLARLDFAMIYVLIAASYTTVIPLLDRGDSAATLLRLVWGTAIAGSLLKVLWVDPPKWACSLLYSAFGSVGLLLGDHVVAALGGPAVALLGLAGVAHLMGGIVYGLQRPDPLPAVFGYHEIFHLLVVIGAGLQFWAMIAYILPATA
jgi:hemolysin III